MNKTLRRLIITLSVFAVLIGLLAWGVGAIDPWVRDRVGDTIANAVSDRVDPADPDKVTAQVAGFSIFTQLASGRLERVTVDAPNSTLGSATGDILLTLKGMPLDQSASFESGTLRVTMPAETLASTAAAAGGDLAGLTAEGNQLKFAKTVSAFGLSKTFEVWLDVAVDGENLVITPVRATEDGTETTIDALKASYGSQLGNALDTRTACVAQYFPRGATLTGITAKEGNIVFDFTLAPDFIANADQREVGTCS